LSEAAKIGYTAIAWPRQYSSAKQQMESNFLRERATLAAPQPVPSS
jgi:anthraniloyl-CoA monooxygenase